MKNDLINKTENLVRTYLTRLPVNDGPIECRRSANGSARKRR